jgi:hypothetical protein
MEFSNEVIEFGRIGVHPSSFICKRKLTKNNLSYKIGLQIKYESLAT